MENEDEFEWTWCECVIVAAGIVGIGVVFTLIGLGILKF